ncbi:MAG: hypothetical protein ACC658_09875 [Acidimicrobiia bacterium]
MSERTPSSDRLRQMASEYEKAVSEARSEQLAARAVARARTSQSLGRPRFAVAAGVSLLLLTVVALGVTSASSLPGDSLYGVSRAYEEVGGWVGVGDSVEQRLNEVIALAERGDGALAAQAASEALEELGLTTNFVPDLTPTTTLPDPEGSGGGAATQKTTPTTPSVSVEVSPEGVDEDSVQTLKLAAELLLISVKNDGGELDAAAAGLAKAVDDLVAADDPVTVEGTSTTTTVLEETSTTTVPDSTTTTEPEDTSTTTFPDTTTTTVPEEGDGKGPIFLPPVP